MKSPAPASPAQATVARALQLAQEGREAEAAALLEAGPSPAGDDLHRRIATRAAHAALQRHESASATAWLDRGLGRNPGDATLNFFRGNLYLDSGHAPEAAACFRRSFTAEPTREEFVCNLGLALVEQRDFDEAVTVLARLPDSASAQQNLGTVHERRHDLVAAAAAYGRSVALRPDNFDAWFNLGGVRDRLLDPAGALTAYNRAVALKPTSARAHAERGYTLAKLKRLEDAALAFERALRLEPNHLGARLALVNVRQRLCDWREFDSLRAHVLEPVLAAAGRDLIAPFIALALPGTASQSELRRLATARAAQVARDAVPLRASATIATGRPLRVGYVSPDFNNHAVGHLVRSLFARHDRQRVSVHGFSLARHAEHEYRTALQAGCDSWDDLDELPDRIAAERIAAREIDVLVDLAGHTKNSRLELFAWRPAPVQATWLGYPGTTGAGYIDWILADDWVIPAEEVPNFSERIHRLPGSYLPADNTQVIASSPQTRAQHGLPDDGVVFCAFNNAYKLEPVVFGAWMQILRRVGSAVLWLRGGNPTIEANLRRAAEARGVDPRRLVFDARSLPKDAHLARHRVADLYLDTHFYNAHTTASDALWAELPVLTCPGRTFASRVGASLVHTLGLGDELVATSLEDYVERAVRFAAEPDHLRDVRAKLTGARITSPLFDTAAFARKLEDAYVAISTVR